MGRSIQSIFLTRRLSASGSMPVSSVSSLDEDFKLEVVSAIVNWFSFSEFRVQGGMYARRFGGKKALIHSEGYNQTGSLSWEEKNASVHVCSFAWWTKGGG